MICIILREFGTIFQNLTYRYFFSADIFLIVMNSSLSGWVARFLLIIHIQCNKNCADNYMYHQKIYQQFFIITINTSTAIQASSPVVSVVASPLRSLGFNPHHVQAFFHQILPNRLKVQASSRPATFLSSLQ